MFDRKSTLGVFALTLVLAWAAVSARAALADDLVRDERRLWSDGSPQEVWTYDGSIDPGTLLRKERFWEDGTKRSRAEFAAGVQHGAARTWYQTGNKETEETWVEGGRDGTVTHWPDPGGDTARKKQVKPKLQATWAGGQPHGVWQEWEGWGDDRWMRVEKSYVEGKLDGFESEWRRKDSLVRKHSWTQGELDGRQLGWDYHGQMEYQYNFAAGEPHGAQRKYEGDTIVQELFFAQGKLHGSMTWEHWLNHLGSTWVEGLRTDRKLDDDGVLVFEQRHEFVPGERFDNEGRLQFHGEDRLVDTTHYYPDGTPERLKVQGSPGERIDYWPNGQMKRRGAGLSQDTGPVTEWYEDGTVFREEQWDGGKKVGEWLIRDRQGRVVQRQTWDFYLEGQVVTLWHDAETKAAEGDIEHGGPSGRKNGRWTYWRPDGSVLRTETYGPGPYSGNRAFITEMVEYDAQERVRLRGSERELVLLDYDAEDPDVVRRKRTVRLLDRSRFGVDSWDGTTLTMKRAAVKTPSELAEGAPEVELLGGRGVVLADERLRADGSPKQVERFNKQGLRDGLQEGWHRSGFQAYSFTYRRGALQKAEEWWSDGTPRLVLMMRGEEIATMSASDKGGRTWQYDGSKPWRGPAELLERCRIWTLAPGTPSPGSR
ncbi:MAG: hypothetical protein KDA24_28840 [Deltaproteobacteria bacterium]|nr:hypothetical protein [Deltaproteobacteria bacterium]